MIALNRFIRQHVTRREESLCRDDLRNNGELLSREIEGKRLLVIGGGGTIGSAFIKAVVPFRPEAVIVVDVSENGLAELIRDLRSTHRLPLPDILRTYPFSFSSTEFHRILEQYDRFDIVANFAAHKHVRSEKDGLSVAAMLRNNVLNTYVLLEELSNRPPEHFFCVSTDKATDPVSVMGASKKLMEEVLMAYSDQFPVTTARFANVAFSRGSLPEAFLYRLSNRQPLAAPRDVERYFISPTEAGEICLCACLLGNSGEIYFPEMDRGSTLRFDQIARSLLNELGYAIDRCGTAEEARQKAADRKPSSKRYPVYFFDTDTSGEKAIESFYSPEDTPDTERFESLGILKASPGYSQEALSERMEQLRELLDARPVDKKALLSYLHDTVSTFRHHDTGKQLDDRM